MAALSCVFLLALAVGPFGVVEAQDGDLQAVLDRFERFEEVDRACVGGVPGSPNALDIVRRDCCSIPLETLAFGDPEELLPCPLAVEDIIIELPEPIGDDPLLPDNPNDYRNCFLEARQQGGGQGQPFIESDDGVERLLVSNTRIFDDGLGSRCFCPIVSCPADRPSMLPPKPEAPSITVSMSPAPQKKPGPPSSSGSG